MILKSLKIICICLRHKINPFGSISKNLEKAAEKFSDSEKEFYINICEDESIKEFLRKSLYKKYERWYLNGK